MTLVEPLPPTSNTLTPAERAHLRRSAHKVGRVLGITPQVMDLGNTNMTEHYWSMTTAMISSHVSLPTLPYSYPSTEFEDERYRYNDAIFIRGGGSKRTMKSAGMPHRPPLLRVSRSAHFNPLSKFRTPLLDPYAPAGLGGEADDDSLPELSTSSSSEEDDISDPPPPALSAPSGTIAMRRRKMERLQRILGQDVPVCMVFPENRTDKSGLARDDAEVSVRSPISTLRSTRSRRPQTAPAGSTCFFPPFSVEEPLSEKRVTTTTTDPVPRAEQHSESFLAQESVPVSPPQKTLRRKRPATPHPHHRPQPFFQSNKRPESEKPADLPAREPPPVLSVPQKTPRQKRPTTPHPHYLPRSFFQQNGNNNKTQNQPATAAKYSYIYYPKSGSNLSCGDGKTTQVMMEFGEAQCLRTIIESPDELESVLAQEAGCEQGQEDLSSSSSSSSSASALSGSSDEWLGSDWESTPTSIDVQDCSGAAAAAVEHDEKKGFDAGTDGAVEPTGRVWRHKRKPPPVYEP